MIPWPPSIQHLWHLFWDSASLTDIGYYHLTYCLAWSGFVKFWSAHKAVTTHVTPCWLYWLPSKRNYTFDQSLGDINFTTEVRVIDLAYSPEMAGKKYHIESEYVLWLVFQSWVLQSVCESQDTLSFVSACAPVIYCFCLLDISPWALSPLTIAYIGGCLVQTILE